MSIESFQNQENPLTDTPFGYTLCVMGGKWKMLILYLLYHHKIVRYNELKRLIGTIT